MRIGTAAGGARRLGTAAAGAPGGAGVPGTARPGTRGGALGGGASLATQVKVSDRPMTQQGLGGMKTARPQGRVVMDHSFFLGAIRTKTSEISTEISKLQGELQKLQRDEATFASYEGKATALATEIRTLQGELADINTMQDKLHTNVDVSQVQAERDEMKVYNDQAQAEVDGIFADRRKIEAQMKLVETELAAEKNWAASLEQQMDPNQRTSYQQLQQQNESALKEIQNRQRRIDELNERIAEVEAELQAVPIKKEVAELHDQLRTQEQRRDAIKAEIEQSALESPEKQRDKLLQQVKSDNQEIAQMERRIAELENDIRQKTDDLENGDADELDDEKRSKYDQLHQRDEEISAFLNSYEDTRDSEKQQMSRLASNIVALLENISRTSALETALPTQDQHQNMIEDLAFKEKEMEKSQSTVENLEDKREKLRKDLENIDQLEGKIKFELETLKERIERMQTELVTYRDIDTLTRDHDRHRQKAATDKQTLQIRRDVLKQAMADVTARLDQLKSQLADNETHTQLVNLEKKWQFVEKNNFVMRDFIATKEMESDCTSISKKVETSLRAINSNLRGKSKAI